MMNRRKANGSVLRRDARLIMHEDEHLLIKAMVWKALGDDDWFGRIGSDEQSESGRAEDRCVLARFLARMERQFELRASEHRRDQRTERDPRVERPSVYVALTTNGSA